LPTGFVAMAEAERPIITQKIGQIKKYIRVFRIKAAFLLGLQMIWSA
jgi:hypothetical protein